jgi:hypothetical protein
MNKYPTIPCPKCSRLIPADGELSVGEAVIPVYSCPECFTPRELAGEVMELPLTFIIGADGKPYDPGDPDGEIDLPEYE